MKGLGKVLGLHLERGSRGMGALSGRGEELRLRGGVLCLVLQVPDECPLLVDREVVDALEDPEKG